MEEIDFNLLKKKAKAGVIVLCSRTAFLQIVTFIATFLLTILLKPEIFGVFFVVSSVIAFLGYFSDIGLAAALIQKKEQLTEDDLKTTFTIQLILVSFLVILAYLFSGKFASFYHLDKDGLNLLRALIIAFFLSSLKTIPSVILERKLDFNLFVIPQIVETLFFYTSVVLLAFLGWGIASFTLGVLLRAVSGLVAIYMLVPWFPQLGFDKKIAKKLLSFGLPFQLNSLLALVKDDLLTIYLGKALGFAGVGFVGWAKKWAEMPLRLVMDNVNKVTFPAFARLQHNPKQLASVVETSLFFVVLLTLPLVGSGLVLMDILVKVIPKYVKWQPALFSFYLFALSVVISSVSSLVISLIQSLGRVKIVLKLMIDWTVLTWVLIPIFTHIYGFHGVAIAIFLISLTSFIPIFISYKLVNYNFKVVFKPLFISLLTTFFMLLGKFLSAGSGFFQLITTGMVGIVTYLILVFLLAKREISGLLNLNK